MFSRLARRVRLAFNRYGCPCCGRRIDHTKDTGSLSYTAGSGLTCCERHPLQHRKGSWRSTRWEYDNTTEIHALPMAWWSKRMREGWLANSPRTGLALGFGISDDAYRLWMANQHARVPGDPEPEKKGWLNWRTVACTANPCYGSHGVTCCVCGEVLADPHLHMRLDDEAAPRLWVGSNARMSVGGTAHMGECAERFAKWAEADWMWANQTLCPEREFTRERQRASLRHA